MKFATDKVQILNFSDENEVGRKISSKWDVLVKHRILLLVLIGSLLLLVGGLIAIFAVAAQERGRESIGIGDGDDIRKNIPIESNIG